MGRAHSVDSVPFGDPRRVQGHRIYKKGERETSETLCCSQESLVNRQVLCPDGKEMPEVLRSICCLPAFLLPFAGDTRYFQRETFQSNKAAIPRSMSQSDR